MLRLTLNTLFSIIPLGTLAANLIGILRGFALASVARPKRCPEWRLFVITGLAEGLPPFSTFSPDTTTLIQQGRRWRAGAAIAGYVAGSLAVTSPGLASCAALKPI